MSIPKEIMDKIESKANQLFNHSESDGDEMDKILIQAFIPAAQYGYQLATDGREQDGEWISVHDNSDGFRNYLDLKGIEYKRNGHFTEVKKEVNLYWLGRQVEEWKQTTASTDGREELEKDALKMYLEMKSEITALQSSLKEKEKEIKQMKIDHEK